MKIIHISFSDAYSGAARAAYRIHQSLRHSGVDSCMWVAKASTGDWTVKGPETNMAKTLAMAGVHSVTWITKILKTKNPIIHSPAILPSLWVNLINSSDADIVHLHWVQAEMLSIADIGRINKPIVWTLHDMWAFCGAEHLAWDSRWREGYRRDNRPSHESGFDLNRWTWQRKRKHWLKPMQIVTPSHWLADHVRNSALMREWPVSVVANPIDTSRWTALEQSLARELMGFPKDVPLLLFGSHNENQAHHKGFDLLLQALEYLHDDPRAQRMELVIFGQRSPQSPPKLGFPIHYAGHLLDDLSLRALYSAVDAIVVPARQEAFGQTASEAHACATPVIAFAAGGLTDVVEHHRTGYLAKAFDTEDLARGIGWVLAQRNSGELGKQARERAEARFASTVVADCYRAVYDQVIFQAHRR